MRTTPVLIAGGGPVGLTLAHELALHGIACLVVERNATTTAHPKMDLTNARSMELYRRLGVAELVRSVGVPPEHCFDVVWLTAALGRVLHAFAYPSQTERWAQLRATEDGSQPSEPPVRISQIVLEPALVESLRTKPTVQHRFDTALEGLVQDGTGVTALLRNTATGDAEQVRARYVIGCDGGGSTVRRLLGIDLAGTPGVRPGYMVHFRSRRHDVLQRHGIAWHLQHATGTIIAQDDDQHWTLQARPPQGVDLDRVDPAEVLRGHLGTDIGAEILVANPWTAHLLVADRYREGRVFLCGDAGHQFIPTGGYGMNTGVADAVDLGWKLAAVLQGWGGDTMLDAYEAERRPVALRNREASGRHAAVRGDIARLYAAHPDADTDPVAAALAAAIARTGNAENEQWGIEHGYRYLDSPVIPGAVDDGGFDPATYRPSCTPGGRLPSVFLDDGTNVYQRLGRGFTLLCVGDADPGAAVEAATGLGIPFGLVRIDRRWSPVYERALVLVRPDHHIAWSADRAPARWGDVLRTACGRSA